MGNCKDCIFFYAYNFKEGVRGDCKKIIEFDSGTPTKSKKKW